MILKTLIILGICTALEAVPGELDFMTKLVPYGQLGAFVIVCHLFLSYMRNYGKETRQEAIEHSKNCQENAAQLSKEFAASTVRVAEANERTGTAITQRLDTLITETVKRGGSS